MFGIHTSKSSKHALVLLKGKTTSLPSAAWPAGTGTLRKSCLWKDSDNFSRFYTNVDSFNTKNPYFPSIMRSKGGKKAFPSGKPGSALKKSFKFIFNCTCYTSFRK